MGAGTRASSLRASSRKWVGSRPTRAGRRNPATRLVTGALRAHNPSIPPIRGDQSRVSCPGTAPALNHETRCARREIRTEDHHFTQQKHVRAAPMTPGDQRARPLGRMRRTHGERSEQSYREHTHGAENFLWPDELMCGILTLERPCCHARGIDTPATQRDHATSCQTAGGGSASRRPGARGGGRQAGLRVAILLHEGAGA